MSKASTNTLSNLDGTLEIDVTQMIQAILDLSSLGFSKNQTIQTLDSDSDLNDFTAGFFIDSWFGEKPVNAPSNFSIYGTFLQLGRTQLVIDNSNAAFSGIAVRSYDENNVFTGWRSI